MMGIAGLAFLIGFVLFVIALALVLSGKIRPRMNAQRHWSHAQRTLLLEGFLLFLVSFVVVALAAGLIEAVTGLDLLPVLIWLLLLTAFWPLVRGMPWRDLHLALGWHANGAGLRGAIKEASLGVVGYLAGLPVVLAFLMVSFLLISLTQSKPSHPAATEAMNADLWTAIKLFVLASLWAPIVEETVFRGLLYYNMRKWAGPILSALVVAFIFAVIHPQGLALVPALMGLAVVFALMREWRGSIIGPMVAHGLHNAFVISLIIFVLGS
jgi:membrane protease YdiL (CAAX protease family)